MVGQSANTGLLAFIVTYMGCFVIPPAGWLQTALSVIVTSETVGGATGSDLQGDFWQGCCAEVAGGEASVWVEFAVVLGLPGHLGFLSIEN